MSESSTQTLAKTTRPVLASSVVPRPRLFRRLDAAQRGSAAWIHGMPGAGKTCLVSSWVEARGLDALWYQVDAGDSDPASFFAHLLHAARRRFGGGAGLPPHPGGAPKEAALRTLFRGVYRGFTAPFVFVLDNCHEAPATSPLHRVLAIAAEEVPSRGTVVFLARHAPGSAAAKLRASETMTVIEPQELQVTGEELRAIAEARGVPLEEDVLQALEDGTRGWAAGLVLMLEHTRGGGAVTRTPEGLAPQVVFDYLAGEVFQNFEPQVRDTLCAIAVLRRCTVALATAVSGNPQAETVLQNLARNSYFLNRVDEEQQTWFELHPLFRNFLARQARERFDAGELAGQVRVAARWLRDHGGADEAVRLLAQAAEWDTLAETVARHGAELFAAPETGGAGRWLRSVPEEAAAAHPWLIYWMAGCRLQEEPRAARRLFVRAHERFAGGGSADPAGEVLSAGGVLRALLEECDDLSLADPWIPVLERALARHGDGLAAADRACAARALYTAMALRGVEPARLKACREVADAAPWPMQALVACLRAEFAAAADLMPDPGPGGGADDAAWALSAAAYHLLRGELEACAAAAARAREAACGGDLAELLAAAAESTCRLHLPADAVEDTATGLPPAGPARLRAALAGYLDAWQLSRAGESLAAFHRVREGAAAAAQLGLRPLEALCQAALAELAAACGDADEAARAVEAARAAHGPGQPVIDFARRLAAAQVVCLSEDPGHALPALEAALATGRGHGLRFSLAFRPAAAAGLCATALRAGIEPEYARSLLRAHGLVGHAPAHAPEQWPWPIRIATLGGLKVLRHDEPLRLSGKGEGRLVELLKVLLALGGRDVPQEKLAESLWPHVDGDYAYRSFTTTVYRLRKLLDVPDAVVVQEGRVSFNPACCWVDTWALEPLSEAVEAAFWAGPGRPDDAAVAALGQDLARLHQGAFLAGDDQHAAVTARRAQLRRRVQRALVRLAGHWESHGHAERAIDLLQRALDADAAAEGLYRELMLLLERLGRTAEVLEVYRICCSSLAASGGEPGERTREIAGRLESAGAG